MWLFNFLKELHVLGQFHVHNKGGREVQWFPTYTQPHPSSTCLTSLSYLLCDEPTWIYHDQKYPQFTLGFSLDVLLLFSSIQSLSRVRLFATPWIAAHQTSLSITKSWSSFKHVHWISDAIQPSHPLSSPSPPALNSSQHQSLFQWVNSSHEMAKVLEFQL